MTDEQLGYHKRLQPLYKRAMGDHQRYYSISSGWITDEDYANYCEDKGLVEFIRVPLTIDSEHPERGLWGMLKDNKVLEENKSYCILWIDENAYEESDPTTAILKALVAQEGV